MRVGLGLPSCADSIELKKLFQVALGIIAAIGGFVDIGELVFNTQAGADFRFQLLWAVPVGVLGIVVFAEMTGRVAAVSGRPVFDVVRMRMGLNVGLVTLMASTRSISTARGRSRIAGAPRISTSTVPMPPWGSGLEASCRSR